MKRGYIIVTGVVLSLAAFAWQSGKDEWQSGFPVDKKSLGATGSNTYFVLTAGFRLYYERGKNTLTTTVLNESYFGEDVDTYKNGKLAGHEGAWLPEVKGAKFGLMMPGSIKVGRKFYQKQAPGVGMDRAEVVGTGETATTPAGAFKSCVHMKETSALEKGN